VVEISRGVAQETIATAAEQRRQRQHRGARRRTATQPEDRRMQLAQEASITRGTKEARTRHAAAAQRARTRR
jgi:hypothetical protein